MFGSKVGNALTAARAAGTSAEELALVGPRAVKMGQFASKMGKVASVLKLGKVLGAAGIVATLVMTGYEIYSDWNKPCNYCPGTRSEEDPNICVNEAGQEIEVVPYDNCTAVKVGDTVIDVVGAGAAFAAGLVGTAVGTVIGEGIGVGIGIGLAFVLGPAGPVIGAMIGSVLGPMCGALLGFAASYGVTKLFEFGHELWDEYGDEICTEISEAYHHFEEAIEHFIDDVAKDIELIGQELLNIEGEIINWIGDVGDGISRAASDAYDAATCNFNNAAACNNHHLCRWSNSRCISAFRCEGASETACHLNPTCNWCNNQCRNTSFSNAICSGGELLSEAGDLITEEASQAWDATVRTVDEATDALADFFDAERAQQNLQAGINQAGRNINSAGNHLNQAGDGINAITNFNSASGVAGGVLDLAEGAGGAALNTASAGLHVAEGAVDAGADLVVGGVTSAAKAACIAARDTVCCYTDCSWDIRPNCPNCDRL